MTDPDCETVPQQILGNYLFADLNNNPNVAKYYDNRILWILYKFDDKWTVSHQHTDNDYQFNQYDTATWKTLKEDSSFKYKEDFARIQYNDGSL